MKDLTERQKEILSFVSSYMLENGKSPTLREIGESFGFSHNAARDAVLALVKKGYLEKGTNEIRSLSFPLGERLERENAPIPFFGKEPSLKSIEENNTEEVMYVPRRIADSNAFAFRVTSESMRNAGILPGDIAILRKADGMPGNDEIILASYSDDEEKMELRRFHPIGNDYAELVPDNDTMGIIKVMQSNLITAGVLTHIRRSYEPYSSWS